MNAMKQIHIVAIAILLGVIAPSCTVTSQTPRYGTPQGPPPELEWMDLRHPGDGFEIRIPGFREVELIAEARRGSQLAAVPDLLEPRLSG